MFAGTVGEWRGEKQFAHPDMHLLDAADDDTDWARALIPIYPATKDVSSWVIQKSVKLLLGASGGLGDLVEDPLPEEIRSRHGLLSLPAALLDIHRPTTMEDVERAASRLKWDEALVLQLTLAARRRAAALEPGIARPRRAGGLLDAVDAALPFALTEGQREVGEELAAELDRDQPMHRLLQGEVGSGKTVVALRAMAQVVDAGGQAALLAPTEVLAAQHARGIRQLLGPLGRAGELDGDAAGTRVTLLTGSLKAAARRQALAEVADGSAGIVIGTHALLQESVEFADLGLVVVDEQHRFGVEQRDALRAKGNRPPHVLVMTATPIPRTVAMTVYGDLEISTLRQLPSGRGGVSSSVVPAVEKPGWLDRAWQRLREEVAGRPAGLRRLPADRRRDRARRRARGRRRRPARGRRPAQRPAPAARGPRRRRAAPLRPAGRAAAGRAARPDDPGGEGRRDAAFATGQTHVLVATTVVEVGVDVPNATVMVVMDADRFGVSQLHQLRGRVARGAHAGLCLLVTDAPTGSPTGARLAAVAATSDGFELARLDLETRREGDVLGAAQSGRALGHPAALPAAGRGAHRHRARRGHRPARRPSAGSPTTPASPPRSRRWPPTSAPTTSRRLTVENDPDHRGARPRAAARRAADRRPPDGRPGPRGDVQQPRLAAGASGAPPCSTSTPAPARSAWRRSAAAPGRCSSWSPAAGCCPSCRTTLAAVGCPAGASGRLRARPSRRPRAAGLRPGAGRPALRDAGRGGARRPAVAPLGGWLAPDAVVVVERGRAARNPGSGRHR